MNPRMNLMNFQKFSETWETKQRWPSELTLLSPTMLTNINLKSSSMKKTNKSLKSMNNSMNAEMLKSWGLVFQILPKTLKTMPMKEDRTTLKEIFKWPRINTTVKPKAPTKVKFFQSFWLLFILLWSEKSPKSTTGQTSLLSSDRNMKTRTKPFKSR